MKSFLINKKIDLDILIKGILFFTFISEYTYSIQLYGYIISLVLTILLGIKKSKVSKVIFIFYCLFVFINIVYVYIHPNFFDSIKYLLYLLPVLFIPSNCTFENFSFLLYEVIEVVCVFFMILAVFGIGLDSSYGVRIQGLLSEPSALAFPCSYLFMCYLHSRSFVKLILICLPLLILSFSPTVYLCVFLVLLLYLFFKLRRYLKLVLIIFSFILLFNLNSILIYFSSEYNSKLAERLYLGVQSLTTLGVSGYNPRVSGIIELFKDTTSSWDIFLFGRGLDSATAFYLKKGSLRLAFNLPSDILFSFGIIGILLFIILLFLSFNFSRKNNNQKCISLFFSILIYTSINSAMGIVFQIYLFIIFAYMVKSKIVYTKK